MIDTNKNITNPTTSIDEVYDILANYMINEHGLHQIKFKLRYADQKIQSLAVTLPKTNEKIKPFMKQLIALLNVKDLIAMVCEVLTHEDIKKYSKLIDWLISNYFKLCQQINIEQDKDIYNCLTDNSYIFNKFALYWLDNWSSFKKLAVKDNTYIDDILVACTTRLPKCRTLALTLVNKVINFNKEHCPQFASSYLFDTLSELKMACTPVLPIKYLCEYDPPYYSPFKQVNVQLASKEDLSVLLDIIMSSSQNAISDCITFHINNYATEIKKILNIIADLKKVSGYQNLALDKQDTGQLAKRF